MDYYSLKRKELQDLCKKHNLPANVTNLKMADNLSALLKPGPTERISLSLSPSLPGYLVTEEMDYYSLKRKELQDLCKKHNLPANVTNLKMADSLSALLKVSEKVEKRTISSLKGSGSGSSGVGGDTKVAKTVRFLDQEQPDEGLVSKVAYQPEETVSESGSRTRTKSLRRERSNSDGPDSEETEAVRENHETSRRVTRSQVAKATDAMAESEQAPGNGVAGDTKVAKTVRFLDQEKPNEAPIPDVTYQPEKIMSESGLRTRRKSLPCTKRSSSDRPHSEETEAVPENHEILRRITRSQAEKAEDTMAESEQEPVAEKEVKKITRKPKNEKKADKAIRRVEEPCPIVVTVLSSSEEDVKNAGKGDDVEKMIAPEIASKEPTVRSPRSHRVTTPAKGNGCEASNEEALKVNEQQQNSHNRRKTRKMMEKAEEETQSDGKVLISEPHVHTRAKDAKTKASAEITCENEVNSKSSADQKVKEEILPEYGGYRVCNTSARTRSRKKLGGAAEEVSCENKENEPILRGKPSRTSRQAAAQKNESANFLEGDSRKSKIGSELQQAADIDKATEQIKRSASQKQAHGSTDEAGEVQEDRVDHGNKILKRSKALKRRKERIVRFKKGFERQRDPLTSDCEGDQEDNADKVEGAEASATHEIMEAATTGAFLSSSNEEIQMKCSGKELQNLGDVKHVHRRKAKRNSLQQNHSLEDLEIVEENNGLESISTQCEDLDLKISLSIFDVDQTKTTEDADDRKEMQEDMELIERRGSEIASEHENTLTNLSDQEQDTNSLRDQHVTDVNSVDERLVHEKKDEQLIDQYPPSPCGRVNLQPGEYNCSEKEKGSLLDKSVVASETALTSPSRKTIPYLLNVNVEPQYQMAVVVDEAIRKDGLSDEMHEVLDEEKEALKAARTVPEMLISDRVPNEAAGLQESSATNVQFASDNNADAELIGSKEIVLDCVSSCMTPMSPAKEQSELGDFMSNGCLSDQLKDHNDDAIPKSSSRPHLELSLGVDAVAESKDNQDIIKYSALMNKIISASSGQNDTDEMVSEDIENENEYPAFTKETRYHGLTKDMFREISQTEAQELREILAPKCGSDASPIIPAMLHSDPASQLRDEVVAPESSCVAELDSEASEVSFLKKEKEDKCLMTDFSSENISTESCHVFGGATYGGGKNICDGCKERSSEAQTTNPVSESEHVTNTDTAMMKKQKEMATDKSRKESNLEDLEYPKDEKFLISYDLSQAISDESQCRAHGCIMDPSLVPASDRIEKHTEATFPIEAFSEGHQNDYGNNQHISEVSKVKTTTCSSSDDEEIKAYDYFDISCDNDSGASVNKSSGSFNYFEEVDNGGDKFSFYSGVAKDERNAETAHEEFDQKHGNETFICGDIGLVDFEYDAHSFEGSESDIDSECTTEAHDAEKGSIKEDALTTFRNSQFLFHKLTSQHGISTNTDTVLEYNQETKGIPKKAATAAEGIKGCTSVRKVSEDVPDSYSSLVKERFSKVDENAKLILHESHMEEGNHHFPVTEISQDVPQIGEHKGCTETTDAAADQQKVALASWSELQEVVQSPRRTFKEPGFDNCAVEGVMEVNKFVFEKSSQTEPEGAQDKNGTVESCSEDLSLEDAVVVHTPVTEYQHVQRFEKHKDHNEMMDVDANQEKVELVNQRELQEAEERSQTASKERDLDQCIIDMNQVNKFALEEHDQTEPERVHGKNGTVENCSEDLSLEDAVVVHTPVTEYQHVQRFEKHKDHNEMMDVDANQEKVELVNQRELQEAEERSQTASKERDLDQCIIDMNQVNKFALEEHDQTEPERVHGKNGTVENCSEDLSLEDAVAVLTPVTKFCHHVQQFKERKHHSETMDADANQSMVALVNQRELQEAEERSQTASKERDLDQCIIDMNQVNKFALEEHDQTEPERVHGKNGTVENCSEDLSLEDAVAVLTPVTKFCHHVQQFKERKHHSETMDADANQSMVALVNQREFQEAEERSQTASKERDLDQCIIDMNRVNKFALEEHDQTEPERVHGKNGTVENCSEDLSLEDAVAVLTPVTKFCHHVQQFKERKHHSETMDADANQSMVALENQRELQEAKEGTQIVPKELHLDRCAVDVKQVNTFVLEEHDQSELEGVHDKNGTVESCSEDLSLEDPVAFPTPVTEFHHHIQQFEEYKDHSETMDADANQAMVELANQRELQAVDEGTQSASKELPDNHCSIDVKQVNKFVLEDHNPTKPEEAQNQNETVERSTPTLGQEVTIMVHMPVEKVCQYVLQTKEHKNCRETMDMDGDRQKVELQEVDDRAQNASKEAKLDYCAVKSVEQVNKFAFQEHNQTKSVGAPDKNEDVERSSRDLRTEDQIVVYTPLKEICQHVLQSGHGDCRETMDADADEQKVELANWEVLQEVEDSTQSSSHQLGLEGAQDTKETVENRSQNLCLLVQTVVKEMSSYVLWIEEHKDCKETIDPDSDRQKVVLAHEKEHQEGEESTQSSPKVLRLDACAVENFKEVMKFAVEEHDQTEPDEAQDRNEVVQSSSQNLSPEDATSFKEEDMKGTENDRNEDGTKISQLADVEEAEGITASSPLNPSLEGARVIHEERREETNNSEGEDWRKIGKIELTENVTDESCEEKEQLNRTKTTVLEVGFVKAHFQEKPDNVGTSDYLKDKELRDGDNRDNSKANEACPQDINVEDHEANIIKEPFHMETVAHANGEIAGVEDMEKKGNDEGDHSSYQPKSTEDGIENDELVHPERKGNDDANLPSYLCKLYEDGKENDEVAPFHPVEAELSMNLGGPPSGTDEIDDICNLMSTTLKISVPPPETSPNTGQGACPMRLTDEEAAEGVEAVSPVPAPAEPETTSLAHLPSQKPKPSALTVVEKATVGAETMMSPARRRNEEAPKENTPSLTMRSKGTVVKEKRETATKTLTAVRRRPLQAISGNNGDHSRLDFTR